MEEKLQPNIDILNKKVSMFKAIWNDIIWASEIFRIIGLFKILETR